MATSLSAISPELAHILGEKQSTLRERQRALVRAGLLEALPGRGRGAGVVASPHSVAMLLTSLLVSPSLADAPALTREMIQALPGTDKRVCSLTGAATFLGALTQVLSDPPTASRTTKIATSNYGIASIEYDKASRCGFVVLMDDVPKMSVLVKNKTASRIRIDISIMGETLQAISALLADKLPS